MSSDFSSFFYASSTSFRVPVSSTSFSFFYECQSSTVHISSRVYFCIMAQAQLPIFRISYADLCHTLSSTEETARWCREKHLLPMQHVCACGGQCRIAKQKGYPEGVCFRCPRKGCLSVLAPFSNTLTLKLEKIVRLIYLWSTVTPLIKMQRELEVSQHSVYYFCFPDHCANCSCTLHILHITEPTAVDFIYQGHNYVPSISNATQ